jgi:HEPN domain-containing protein
MSLTSMRPELDAYISNYDLMVQLQELRGDIAGDLTFRRFALVPHDKTDLYDKRVSAWGAVWKHFPKAESDTREAIDSYVLGLNTATVFHAMRIAEIGLRALARRLRVTLTHKQQPMPIDLADWEKIITQCRNKIAALRAMAKGHKNANRLQLYSEAAEHCGFMKDIFRNDVSHGRKAYNAGEALGCLNRVHDFMQFLATAMGKL